MKSVLKYAFLKMIPAKRREYWAISLLNSIGYGETSLDSEVNNFFSKANTKLMDKFGILDIGASKGEWAERAIKKSEKAVVYCFEPQIEPMRTLEKKMYKFIKTGRCKTYNYALGGKKMNATLYADSIGAGSASLIPKKDKQYKYETKIKVRNFETEIKKIKIPIIGMKIDTEGYEFEILLAAKALMKSEMFQLVQFEFGEYTIEKKQSFHQYFDYLSNLNFKIYRMSKFGLRLITVYEPRLEVHWNTNYLAVRH